jgi:hypothetical protein
MLQGSGEGKDHFWQGQEKPREDHFLEKMVFVLGL